MANRYQRQRKGIILLAIISLLTMFMLIGVTYVVVSGHFKRAAISNAQSRQLGVAPKKHLDSCPVSTRPRYRPGRLDSPWTQSDAR